MTLAAFVTNWEFRFGTPVCVLTCYLHTARGKTVPTCQRHTTASAGPGAG